jgi:hypothetical protein
MDHENTEQEVPQIIDPATLCEHCPFAPQNAEGNGQQRAAEKALGASLKTQEIDRQMPLPFEDQFESEGLPENEPESSDSKPFDDLTQRLALAYLMREDSEAGSGLTLPADPAQADRLDIKAEVEHLEQRAEREEVHDGNVADQPDPNGVAALLYPASDGAKSSKARTDTCGMIKGADRRAAQEQKGTTRQGGQHRADTQHREAPKDERGADRESL